MWGQVLSLRPPQGPDQVQGQCSIKAELHWLLQESGGSAPGWRPDPARVEPGGSFSAGHVGIGHHSQWGPGQHLLLCVWGGSPTETWVFRVL